MLELAAFALVVWITGYPHAPIPRCVGARSDMEGADARLGSDVKRTTGWR